MNNRVVTSTVALGREWSGMHQVPALISITAIIYSIVSARLGIAPIATISVAPRY
jgi:hypothetical protein